MLALLIAQFVLVLITFIFGAALGSFLGVVIERVPKGESINGRSHCACGRQLTWYENIPVVGWLRVGGRTRCCGVKLPLWYLLLEIAGGLIFAAAGAYVVFGTHILG